MISDGGVSLTYFPLIPVIRGMHFVSGWDAWKGETKEEAHPQSAAEKKLFRESPLMTLRAFKCSLDPK